KGRIVLLKVRFRYGTQVTLRPATPQSDGTKGIVNLDLRCLFAPSQATARRRNCPGNQLRRPIICYLYYLLPQNQITKAFLANRQTRPDGFQVAPFWAERSGRVLYRVFAPHPTQPGDRASSFARYLYPAPTSRVGP